jgi:hypothetical protein
MRLPEDTNSDTSYSGSEDEESAEEGKKNNLFR